MKSFVLAWLLLLGFGAQAAALPCPPGVSGAHPMQTGVRPDVVLTAVEFDRAVHEQHCHCPTQSAVAQNAVTGPQKMALPGTIVDSAVSQDSSFAEKRLAHNAHGRSLSGDSPGSALPTYLLTARLRC